MEREKEKRERKKVPSVTYSVRDILRDKPHIELQGNTLATVEGSKGVLEYSDAAIRVSLGAFSVSISGRGLNLKCISSTVLVIEGYFSNIEFGL